MEQQQPGSCDSKSGRTGKRNLSRNMQYYLHNYRRLWRNSISTAGCYNFSRCKYYISNRINTSMYRSHMLSILQMELYLAEAQEHGAAAITWLQQSVQQVLLPEYQQVHAILFIQSQAVAEEQYRHSNQ